MATRNRRAALAFQSLHWLCNLGYPPHQNNRADNPQRIAVRKKSCAKCCLHAANPKKCMQSAVLQAGPVATDSHKAILWSMGLLRLSEPGQMFIQELRETRFGPQKAAQRTHSLTFHPAAFLASSHSLSYRGPVGSANLWSALSPPPEPIPGRKES